ncbi:type II secretion system protein [Rubellicoccus peritrichatus]|uniref:Type II secretion system protein n=1 Tax=Rubellicoccus peritrichatus TaxID=3080537 RepID=A0AAQ3LDX2_9BACT|nr:type II secretion system protein [Puniceicoccus sp. CR14]WOO41773.1 type II secretion system protein [Puniceicoccus sp. CR14]
MRTRKHQGFTLPELMMAMVIFGFVAAGVYSALFSFAKATNVAMDHLDESARNQFALQKVQQAVRSASEVHKSKADEFEFSYTDLAGDVVRWSLLYDTNSGELKKHNVTEDVVSPLLSDVDNLSFTYYDRFGEETTTQVDINAVKITLETEKTTTAGSKSIDMESTIITFRNRSL